MVAVLERGTVFTRGKPMKIQLNYDRPSQIQTDLLVVIADSENDLFSLSGTPLEETVSRIVRDLNNKKIKKEYFTALDSKSAVKP